MASKNYFRVQSYEREVKQLYAKVTVTGSDGSVTGNGLHVSASHSGSGVYDFDLRGKYPEVLGVESSILSSSAVSNWKFQMTLDEAQASGSVQLSAVSGTNNVAGAIDEDLIIGVRFDVKNSG